MLFPKDKMSRIVILVIAVVAVLIPLNIYQKKLGKNVALVCVVATLVVAAGFGYVIMNETEEGFNANANGNEEDDEDSPAQQQQIQLQIQQQQKQMQQQQKQMQQQQQADEVVPNNDSNSVPQQVVEADSEGPRSDCSAKQVLDPNDLLPLDTNSVWAQSAPAGQGALGDKNFLNAGFHIGVNTVGQTLRNANRQLRSDPPNPQVKVSPWLQTTIEPDLNRRPMEIGGGN
jgi:hypothetical protein